MIVFYGLKFLEKHYLLICVELNDLLNLLSRKSESVFRIEIILLIISLKMVIHRTRDWGDVECRVWLSTERTQ